MEVDQPDHYLAPSTTPGPSQRAPEVSPSHSGRSCWRGAVRGARILSAVGLPLGAVGIIMGLALSAMAFGAGRGFALSMWTVRGAVCVLGFAAYGASVGAILGLIGGVLRKARPDSRRWRLYERLHRPIGRQPVDGTLKPSRLSRIAGFYWRTLPWLIGIPGAVVIVGSLITGVRIGAAVDERLDAAIAAADDEDPHWRLDDLMAHRTPVPPEENSAIIVEEVLWHLPEEWPNHEPPEKTGWVNPPPTSLEQAVTRLAELDPNVRLDEPTAARLREEREAYPEAVELARSLANYEQGSHDLWIGPAVIDTRLPETQASRTVARFLNVDAAILAHEGDLDRAIDSCRAILGVARSIGDEPFLISQLVRIAIGGVGIQAAERVLGQGEATDSALERLQADLFDEYQRPLVLYGMKGERGAMFEMIRRIATQEIPLDALSEGGDVAAGGSVPAVSPWGRLSFENQMALALEFLNEAVAISSIPAHERAERWEAWEDWINDEHAEWHAAWTKTLPILMTPACQAGDLAHRRYQAELGSMVILLAAERYRLRHGDWPQAVELIDHDLLPGVPLDPFSGKDFLMHRPLSRWIVASVGPNGRDDGGSNEPRRWSQGGPDDVGAIAWDILHRNQPALPLEPIPSDLEDSGLESAQTH